MNPAALAVNIKDLRPGGIVVINTGNFKKTDLAKAQCESDPREDGTLDGYQAHRGRHQRARERRARGVAALDEGEAALQELLHARA